MTLSTVFRFEDRVGSDIAYHVTITGDFTTNLVQPNVGDYVSWTDIKGDDVGGKVVRKTFTYDGFGDAPNDGPPVIGILIDLARIS